jgi:hypothetical protein
VRDDLEAKDEVGKLFIPLAGVRLEAIKEYREILLKHEDGLWRKEEMNETWVVEKEEKGLSSNIDF